MVEQALVGRLVGAANLVSVNWALEVGLVGVHREVHGLARMVEVLVVRYLDV